MLMSILAWVLRFGLFGIGNPGPGLSLLVMSMIIYGLAFDFFNISGSLFVKTETDSSMVASAQGLFMLMTNGSGAFLGGTLSGIVVDHFTVAGMKNWPSIWFTFAGYALILAIVFPFIFKYKHDPKALENIQFPDNFRIFEGNPAKGYPITGLTWLLVYTKYDSSKVSTIKQLVEW